MGKSLKISSDEACRNSKMPKKAQGGNIPNKKLSFDQSQGSKGDKCNDKQNENSSTASWSDSEEGEEEQQKMTFIKAVPTTEY